MKIKTILSQHRRDFRAEYECEHCGHTHEGDGYDDTNFHVNIIPKIKCPKCGKTGRKRIVRWLRSTRTALAYDLPSGGRVLPRRVRRVFTRRQA